MHLLSMIERHLRRTGMTPSRFGREAMSDPGFVPSLRAGREPRTRTEQRVLAYLAAQQEAGR